MNIGKVVSSTFFLKNGEYPATGLRRVRIVENSRVQGNLRIDAGRRSVQDWIEEGLGWEWVRRGSWSLSQRVELVTRE
jgi:hypothetical protein